MSFPRFPPSSPAPVPGAIATVCGSGEQYRLAALPAGSIVLRSATALPTVPVPVRRPADAALAATGWRVVNAGVPGDTADAGKARIRELLEAHKPALVIVEIGGNDFLRRRPAAVVKEDVRSIVRQSKVAGVQVVLVAVPELSLLGALTRRGRCRALCRNRRGRAGAGHRRRVFGHPGQAGIVRRPDSSQRRRLPENGRGHCRCTAPIRIVALTIATDSSDRLGFFANDSRSPSMANWPRNSTH